MVPVTIIAHLSVRFARLRSCAGGGDRLFSRRAMPRPRIAHFLLATVALALASCAPKAELVADAPIPKPAEKTTPVEPIAPEPEIPTLPDNEFRMPDLTGLPTDADFRATTGAAAEERSGAVTSRPPTDPPSRVKPAEKPE